MKRTTWLALATPLRTGTLAFAALAAVGCGGDDAVTGETNCTDKLDEDFDGLVDCADPDCRNDAACEGWVDSGDTDTDTDTDTEPPKEPIVIGDLAAATLLGESSGGWAGFSVAGAGDVNNDGNDDLLVGAPLLETDAGLEAGAAYIVHGPITGDLDLADAPVALYGADPSIQLGWSVESAGDVNADGLDDVVIGARRGNRGSAFPGVVYVLRSPVDPATWLTTALVLRDRPDGANIGSSLASRGDLAGNGSNWLMVGAEKWSTSTDGDAGAVFVIDITSLDGDVNLSDRPYFTGESDGDNAGRSEAFVDLDGDGADDIAIGAWHADGPLSNQVDAGAVYLHYETPSGTLALQSADVKLSGDRYEAYLGQSMASAGDFDNDGRDDLVVGAYGDATKGLGSGAVYLLYGKATPWDSGEIFTASVKITGSTANDQIGADVIGPGDLNGDGIDDIVIGGFGYDNALSERGAAYPVFGGLDGTIHDLEDIAAEIIMGKQRSDELGNALGSAGDVDKDGRPDFLIGSNKSDQSGNDAGAAYLILGGW